MGKNRSNLIHPTTTIIVTKHSIFCDTEIPKVVIVSSLLMGRNKSFEQANKYYRKVNIWPPLSLQLINDSKNHIS